jgi:SAM-dependent methyltransferase
VEPAAARSLLRLHCGCGSVVHVSAEQASCQRCSLRITVDELGILRLTESDHAWDVHPDLDRLVRNATSAKQVTAAMAEGESFLPPELQQQLLHPSGGVAATLVPTRPGTTALDLATGWNTLPSALTSLGANAVSADWVYSRLRFSQLMNEGVSDLTVHLESNSRLPWPSASFDFVFVDLANLDHPPVSRSRILSEVRRVLTVSGIAVIGTQNPLRRRRDRHTRCDRQPSSVTLPVRSLVASAPIPWRPRAIMRAGFSDLRTFVAHPRRHGWQRLVPEQRLRDHYLERASSRSAKEAVRRCILRLGAAKLLAADYFVLARSESGQGAPRTLPELLPGMADDHPPEIVRLSDARVAVIGSEHFVKLPLSVDQQTMLVGEVENTLKARKTAFRPHVVPSGAVRYWHAAPYSTFPRIDTASSVPRAGAERAVLDALTRLNTGTLAPIDSTTFWRRLKSERGRNDTLDLQAWTFAVLRAQRVAPAVPRVGR